MKRTVDVLNAQTGETYQYEHELTEQEIAELESAPDVGAQLSTDAG